MERASQQATASSGAAAPLTPFVLVSLVLAALLALLFWRRRRRGSKSYEKWLEGLPGPRRYPLGGYLNSLELVNPKSALAVGSKWIDRGNEPIVRVDLGPVTHLMLNSPNYIQKVWGSMNLDHIPKPWLVWDAFKPVAWFDGVGHSEGEKWKSRRKLIAKALSYSSLSSYVDPLNESSRTLVESLHAQFGREHPLQPAPIQNLLFYSIFNSICKTVFGVDVDERRHDDDDVQVQRQYSLDEFVRVSNRYMEIISIRVLRPWLHLLLPFTGLWAEVQEYLTISKGFILQLVREAEEKGLEEGGGKGGKSQGTSIVREFVQAGLGFDGIYEEVVTLFIAGPDTTGTALHFLLFFLALHPDHQETCRSEVDLVFGDADGDDSSNSNKDLTEQDLKNFGFLEQCIYETMRMVPPVFTVLRKLKAPVRLEEGVELPVGMTVGVFLPAIHNNPEVYPNPEKFQPERFSPEARASRHQYSYLPFAAGPRGCVGSKLAMMQLLITSAHLLRHFRFSTPDKFEQIQFLPHTTLTPQRPMKFLFQKRRLQEI